MKRGEKNSKKVNVTTDTGEGLRFASAEKAAKELNMNAVVLRRYCRDNTVLKSGIKKGWGFKYDKIAYEGDAGVRNSPPVTLGELISDLKMYPKNFELEINVDVNFDLISTKGNQKMIIQPSHRLRGLLIESEQDGTEEKS